jgi:glycosyltransferase involved in cell wall biosynthesis
MVGEKMSFSVLMSVYHKEDSLYLKEAIKSILCQTKVPSEIVLVKDGPLTSELEAVIKEFVESYKNLFKIVPLKQNVGLGKALEIGLKECTYPLVGRMDSDDLSLENRFEKQLDFLENHLEYDVVGAWIEEFDEDPGVVKAVRRVPEHHEEIFKLGKYRNPMNHVTVMFRKDKVIESGSYQSLLWFEDYYLWFRMIKDSKRFYNLQESLVKVRGGTDMLKRRGGIKYIKYEFLLQKIFLESKYINVVEFIYNLSVRVGTRILPNNVRGLIYTKVLRK